MNRNVHVLFWLIQVNFVAVKSPFIVLNNFPHSLYLHVRNIPVAFTWLMKTSILLILSFTCSRAFFDDSPMKFLRLAQLSARRHEVVSWTVLIKYLDFRWEVGYNPGQVASCRRANTERLPSMHIHTSGQFIIVRWPNLHVTGLWEESRVPKGNPNSHR